MTDIIKTVGPGCDYADFAAADAAIPTDLVAASQRWILRVPASFTVSSRIFLKARTCSALYHIEIVPSPGMGHNVRADRFTSAYTFDATKGVVVTSTTAYEEGMQILSPYTVIDGMQFRFYQFDITNGIVIGGQNCTLTNNIISHGAYSGSSSAITFENFNSTDNGNNSTVFNNLIISTVAAGYSPRGIFSNAAGCTVSNNICHSVNGSSGPAFGAGSGANAFFNNAAFGFTGAVSGSAATGSNNATSQSTFGIGTAPLLNQVFANTFTSTTDYRLKTTAPAKNAGVTVSGRSTDVFGQALGSPPSIGSNEPYVAVADTTPPTMTGTMTSSGVSATGYTLDWSATTRADNVAIGGYQHSVDGTTWTDSGNVTLRSFTGKSASTSYPNYVRAYDTATTPNYSTPALLLNVTTAASAADTTAPNLAGSITQGAIGATSSTISWPAATDNVAVDHYEVSKDSGSTWTTVAVGTLTYTFTGLSASTTYGQRVRALDAAGNVSAVLAAAVTTSAAGTTATITSPSLGGKQVATGAQRVSVACNVTALDKTTHAVLERKIGLTCSATGVVSFTSTVLAAGTERLFIVKADANDKDLGMFFATPV